MAVPATTRPSASGRWAIALATLIAVVLLAAATYEVSVAVGALSLGSVPGEGPPGSDAVLGVAMVALIAGGLLSAVRVAPVSPTALLGPAAVAFVAARFYTYDPYYLPTLRRLSDGGAIPPGWVYSLIALALVAAALTFVRPRLGHGITAILLLLCLVTTMLEGSGH